jgi:hypothetical protein
MFQKKVVTGGRTPFRKVMPPGGMPPIRPIAAEGAFLGTSVAADFADAMNIVNARS